MLAALKVIDLELELEKFMD